jgi:hypothetical protein
VGVYTANTMTFYRNGVYQGTTTNTHTNVSQDLLPLWIGRGVSGNYFNGSLDDIGIWNRVLTPNEVAILYQSSLSGDSFSASSIKLYPNPASDFLQLEVDSQNIGTAYQIFDDLGRIVATGTTVDTTTEISVSSLKTGMYFVKIGEQKPLKFIKN